MQNIYFLTLLFWGICAAVFVNNKGQTTLWLRPQSVHVWRQTDCTSYALNYYQNNQPFFQPQTQTLIGKNGHTVSEFPIIYYIAGKLYHVFGFHDYIIRIIDFSIFLFGCTCLLLLGFELFEWKLLALIPALITFTSPYLFYYGLNFLPDVPALSFALAGCFFGARYFRNKKLSLAWAAGFFFCLGALLKVSAGIMFLAVVGGIIVTGSWRTLIPPKQRLHVVILCLAIIAVNAAWIEFAIYYNRINDTIQNLLGLYPIWDADRKEIKDICTRFMSEWLPVILHPAVWVWMGMLLPFIAWNWRRTGNILPAIAALVLLGSILYCLGWFRAFYHHDYYMINAFAACIWIMLAACMVADKSSKPVKYTFFAVFAVMFGFAVYQCRAVQVERYYAPHSYYYEPYFDMEPYLRSIGISRHDIVISAPDASSNITLYFMNQPGWTELFNSDIDPNHYKAQTGAKYLILGDSTYAQKPVYAKHIVKQIGQYKGICIYTTRP